MAAAKVFRHYPGSGIRKHVIGRSLIAPTPNPRSLFAKPCVAAGCFKDHEHGEDLQASAAGLDRTLPLPSDPSSIWRGRKTRRVSHSGSKPTHAACGT